MRTCLFVMGSIGKHAMSMKGLPKAVSRKNVAATLLMPKCVVIVDECAQGREGLKTLLENVKPRWFIVETVSSLEAFWRLHNPALERTVAIIVHIEGTISTIVAGRAFICQVRLLLPHLRVMVLSSGSLGLAGGTCTCAWESHSNYGLPLKFLLESLVIWLRKVDEDTTQAWQWTTIKEWRALAGALGGVPIHRQARELGVHPKTLYTQRISALRRLGLRSLRDLFNAGVMSLVFPKVREYYLRGGKHDE